MEAKKLVEFEVTVEREFIQSQVVTVKAFDRTMAGDLVTAMIRNGTRDGAIFVGPWDGGEVYSETVEQVVPTVRSPGDPMRTQEGENVHAER